MATKKKLTLSDYYRMKKDGEAMVWITSYTHPQASFAEKAGVDMILVGDSGGMCILGYENTIPVTMEEGIGMARAVRRGAPNTFIVGDMPFMSYQVSCEEAVRNAGRFIKEAMCDAIKLEGGVCVAKQIRAIVDAGIIVIGHAGMTPQSSGALGGYKAQGRTVKTAKTLIEDSIAIYEAGAHMLLLEAVPPECGKFISELLPIPVYGIGAGGECDGQLLIISDVIGEFQAFTPKFVKKYCNVAEVVTNALTEYAADVRGKTEFPKDPEHCYHVMKKEMAGVTELFDQYKAKFVPKE